MTDDSRWITRRVDSGLSEIVINRPDKHNALNYAMWQAIRDLARHLSEDPNVGVILFRSSHSAAFSSGADISEFSTRRNDPESAKAYHRMIDSTIEAIRTAPQPTIALLEGYTVGGGAELALACDLRFASPTLKIGITPAKLGIVYGPTGTKLLVDLVGPSRAKDILFSGRLLDAEEAYAIGLVDRIWPSETLHDETRRYAESLLWNAPNTLSGAKQIIHALIAADPARLQALEQSVWASVKSPEYQEGVRAFLEKRRPVFRHPNKKD